jgi:hypothetical protein
VVAASAKHPLRQACSVVIWWVQPSDRHAVLLWCWPSTLLVRRAAARSPIWGAGALQRLAFPFPTGIGRVQPRCGGWWRPLAGTRQITPRHVRTARGNVFCVLPRARYGLARCAALPGRKDEPLAGWQAGCGGWSRKLS